MESSWPQKRRYWLGGKRHYEQDRFFEAALDGALWEPGDSESWHACWYTGMPKPAVFRKTGPDRKINHIPGNNVLTVKSRLHDTLVTTRKRIEEQFGTDHQYARRLDFLPHVFSMPRDYHALQQAALEDPEQRWILKPKNAARGKGIRLVSDVADIPMEESWMVQEYLHNTHIMYGRKYVLRLYVLISSIDPLRLYLYHQGFAKLASAPYDINDTDNVYSHLTNPDINALNDDAEVPVEFVDFEHYRQWLRAEGHDDGQLFERIHDMVTLTGISAVEAMRKRTQACGADPRGCYELLGIDCLVDADLKPWILECNLSPSMGVCAAPDSGGDIEEQVKGQMVADMVSLVDLGNAEAVTDTRDPEAAVIDESRAELARSGGFVRLYPTAEAHRYLPYFALPRLKDRLLAQAHARTALDTPRLQRRHGVDIIADDQLAVYEAHTGQLNELNETATLTWLMALEGYDPDEIATTIYDSAAVSAEAQGTDWWTIRRDVWDSLAQWATQGLIMQRVPRDAHKGSKSGDHGTGVQTVDALRETTEPFQSYIACAGRCFEFFCDSPAVVHRLEPLLAPMQCAAPQKAVPRLEVVRDTPGYTIILAGEVIETRRPLAAIAATLFHHLARRTAGESETVMDVSLAVTDSAQAGAVAFVHSAPGVADALAVSFAGGEGGRVGRGLHLGSANAGQVGVIGLPLQVTAQHLDGNSSTGPTQIEALCFRLADGSEGRLMPTQIAAGRVCDVETVVIPDTEGVLEGAWCRSLSVTQVLRHLLPHCHGPGREPLDAEAVNRLAEWLGCRNCLLVDAQNPDWSTEWRHHAERRATDVAVTANATTDG